MAFKYSLANCEAMERKIEALEAENAELLKQNRDMQTALETIVLAQLAQAGEI